MYDISVVLTFAIYREVGRSVIYVDSKTTGVVRPHGNGNSIEIN